jgi:cellulose synthase/poly-beta-1,6-N-acetylglucosamine synthase-like glycosyltransferase
MFKPAPDGAPTEGIYWRYEVMLKFLESRLNMMVGANGGIYAVRRHLYSPIPVHGIIDDFLVSMAVHQKGYRLVYDPEAVAVEEAAASVGDEFGRRVRIGAGNFSALRYTWRLLLPTAGAVSVALWSHKIFRWLVPFALLTAFTSAVALAAEPLYAVSAVAALGLTAMAGAGYLRERSHTRMGSFGVPYYFLSMNLALALGLVRCLTSTQAMAWSRTPRESSRGAEQ